MLFIDADACPVTRDALAVARRCHVPVIIAGNSTQNLERHIRRDDPRTPEAARKGFWVDTLAVGVSTDSAYTVDWDLTVDGGRRLQTGVYLYRVRLGSDGSGMASKAKKLIIVDRQ